MKNTFTRGVVLFTLALLLGFYGSSAYHKQKALDPKAYQEALNKEALDRRYQVESDTHPIMAAANDLGLGEKKDNTENTSNTTGTTDSEDTLDILNIQEINTHPQKKEILAQWEEEWRNTRPKYKGQVAISIYIVDPTNSEMWQVASPKDGEEIIRGLDSVSLVEAPELGMDLGFMIITAEERLHLYVSDSPETKEGKSIRDLAAPIKGRSLQSVDLFQLILEDQIKNLAFTAYINNREGELEKVTINTTDTKMIGEVLKEFRKVHVSKMEINSNGSTLKKELEPTVAAKHYHLLLDLASPYEEGSQMEITGYPLAFFAEFTPQGGKMRVYDVDNGATNNLLAAMTGIPILTTEKVPEDKQEKVGETEPFLDEGTEGETTA